MGNKHLDLGKHRLTPASLPPSCSMSKGQNRCGIATIALTVQY